MVLKKLSEYMREEKVTIDNQRISLTITIEFSDKVEKSTQQKVVDGFISEILDMYSMFKLDGNYSKKTINNTHFVTLNSKASGMSSSVLISELSLSIDDVIQSIYNSFELPPKAIVKYDIHSEGDYEYKIIDSI
jgi:hypothetical protein